ncbi:hypothetical protein [Virgibacillus sp. Bac330]|uniref:hypothetical protein n=1 Tax=Virgibacillus sp. Bac330 TaxID=2419841 RepID=UPI00352BB821
MEVDWAGSSAFIIDRDTGEKIKAYVFVTTLSCNYGSYLTSLSMRKLCDEQGSTLLGY